VASTAHQQRDDALVKHPIDRVAILNHDALNRAPKGGDDNAAQTARRSRHPGERRRLFSVWFGYDDHDVNNDGGHHVNERDDSKSDGDGGGS